MKKSLSLLLGIFLLGTINAQSTSKNRYPAISCEQVCQHPDVALPTNQEEIVVADRTTNNLCVTFLLCSDGVLSVNTTVMNSMINSCNTWLTNTHNPLTGPDYQITSYEVITMPPNVTLSDATVLDLTIAGNSAGAWLMYNVADWKFDIGNTDLTVVVVPNNAGSGYSPGVALWGIGENLIGTELGVTVLKCSSNTIINFNTFLMPHEIFGHLQGLDFSATNPSDAPHSNQSCNGGTDYINAAPNNLQICSDAAGHIAAASDSGDGSCSSLLPVELLTFEASTLKQQVRLHWATADEHKIALYEVEKSTDGTVFYNIGVQRPQNSGANITDYHWIDSDNRLTPTVYYRLRLVESEGAHSYSRIVSVTSETPNWGATHTLFGENIHLNWPSEAQECTATLFNAQGIAVQTSQTGDTPVSDWSLPYLPAGLYWLHLRADGWEKTQVVVRGE